MPFVSELRVASSMYSQPVTRNRLISRESANEVIRYFNGESHPAIIYPPSAVNDCPVQ